MLASWTRIRAMIVKEIWAALRDPKSRNVLFLPPLLQLLLFSYATTLDVKNIDIGVLNTSTGRYSTELVERIAGSPNFRRIVRLNSPREMREAIEQQKVIAALVIDGSFDANIARAKPARVGVVLDGRRSNAAQIVAGYLGQIVAGMGGGISARAKALGSGTTVTHWYNPSLDYLWFTIPSLVAVLLAVAGLGITSLTVAREREVGTFDQLMVSPLRMHEILIGKMTPPLLIGILHSTLFLIIAPPMFGVPFGGSIPLYYVSVVIYMLSLIGVGMLVSSASHSQQQAFMGVFFVMNPLIILSGYSSPIDNMPEWLQTVSYVVPARYFLIIVQGLFLKGMTLAQVWHQLWPLMIIAIITLGLSAWMFRARME